MNAASYASAAPPGKLRPEPDGSNETVRQEPVFQQINMGRARLEQFAEKLGFVFGFERARL
jgi:hypothetical protein